MFTLLQAYAAFCSIKFFFVSTPFLATSNPLLDVAASVGPFCTDSLLPTTGACVTLGSKMTWGRGVLLNFGLTSGVDSNVPVPVPPQGIGLLLRSEHPPFWRLLFPLPPFWELAASPAGRNFFPRPVCQSSPWVPLPSASLGQGFSPPRCGLPCLTWVTSSPAGVRHSFPG